MKCLRCGQEMNHMSDQKIHLGQTGWLLGDWPNLLAGALEVSIYVCPSCGKLEFYRADHAETSHAPDHVAQRQCPRCGRMHDMDYPRCPYCKYDYLQR